MPHVITFGEIMARVAAPGFLRFRQCLPGPLDVTFAGAEANVAASLAMLGMPADLVTALPSHAIADACIDTLRGLGIGVDRIVRTDEGRLGIYFLETGANQRPSQVIYDRAGSSISRLPAEAYDWHAIFDGADWFHVTGITPAVSATAAAATRAAVAEAKQQGLKVSCDLNFRKKLWSWDAQRAGRPLAEATMREILPFVDLLIANEEDCAEVLGIRAGDSNVDDGQLEIERYPDVARQVVAQFSNLQHVAITLRESISASHNNWGGMLYVPDTPAVHFAPLFKNRYQPYQIRSIVDRVGGGDAFAAGLIFALLTPELSQPQTALEFALAASCLAHSIVGDFNFASRAEVEKLMRGSGSGRGER